MLTVDQANIAQQISETLRFIHSLNKALPVSVIVTTFNTPLPITPSADPKNSPTVRLSTDSDLDLYSLIFTHNHIASHSDLTKIICLSYAFSQLSNYSELRTLSTQLGFSEHTDTQHKLSALCKWPIELLLFYHKKQFSFKQAFHLTRIDKQVQETLILYKDALQLSASVFIELSESFQHILKQQPNYTMDSLLKRCGFSTSNSRSPSQRTQALREALYTIKHPRLQAECDTIDSSIQALDSPRFVDIRYDKSRENKYIDLTIRLSKDQDSQVALDWLQKKETDINSLLETL